MFKWILNVLFGMDMSTDMIFSGLKYVLWDII